MSVNLKGRRHPDFIDKRIQSAYQLGRKIGRGCYGNIFEVRRVKTQRLYAMKKIMEAFRNNTDAQRAYREVTYLMEFVGHSNIITLYDVLKSEDDRHLYLVTDIMDADLQRVLRNSVLQPVHRMFISYQIFRALKYIHSAGVMHRDIKPANILINRACEVKLCDFGQARSVCEPEQAVECPLTDYVSTRWYRAPEMLLGSTSYSRSIDIWATGCIICEMQGAGQPLFPGQSTMTMMEFMIDALGTPSKNDTKAMRAPYVVGMLDCLPPAKPVRPLTQQFPQAGLDLQDLMQLTLQWSPEKRLTAEEALMHPYYASLHNPDNEPSMQRQIMVAITDLSKHTVSDYRDQIYADIVEVPRSKRRVHEKLVATAAAAEKGTV